MKFFRFIKWWWTNLSDGGKFGMAVLLWLIFNIILGTFLKFPIIAVLIFISPIPLSFIVYWVISLYDYITTQWKEFEGQRERDAQEIIDRLKGK